MLSLLSSLRESIIRWFHTFLESGDINGDNLYLGALAHQNPELQLLP